MRCLEDPVITVLILSGLLLLVGPPVSRVVNELQILGKVSGPVKVLIVVPQVDEDLNNFLLRLLSIFVDVNEVNHDMLVHCAVATVHGVVDLWGICDPVVVDVKDQLLKLEPRYQGEVCHFVWIFIESLDVILTKGNDPQRYLPLGLRRGDQRGVLILGRHVLGRHSDAYFV